MPELSSLRPSHRLQPSFFRSDASSSTKATEGEVARVLNSRLRCPRACSEAESSLMMRALSANRLGGSANAHTGGLP